MAKLKKQVVDEDQNIVVFNEKAEKIIGIFFTEEDVLYAMNMTKAKFDRFIDNDTDEGVLYGRLRLCRSSTLKKVMKQEEQRNRKANARKNKSNK